MGRKYYAHGAAVSLPIVQIQEKVEVLLIHVGEKIRENWKGWG